MKSTFYAPESIPMPVLPGSRAAGALQQAWNLQTAPIQVPAQSAALLQAAAGGHAACESCASTHGSGVLSASDPMAELGHARFRSGQGRAAEPLSHDGKGKYKKLPPPLEKPEWWIPTPAEWGAPQEHASGSFYGPAQIPSPAVGGFGAPQQSDSPPILLASLWQHQYSSGAALLQKSARKHAG